MKALSVREMRAGYQALEQALKEEGEVLLTHHGKPFARVLPYEAPKKIPSLAEHRAKIPFQTIPSEVLIREDRDAR